MIIPSLDFINGRIVRLYQGNYSNKTLYDIDVFKHIDQYINEGLTYIHLVDLDGCNNPEDRQKNILKIISHYRNKITFQVGGGIRSIHDIENLLRVGVSKIVIGTIAINQPDQFKQWLLKYGSDRFVLATDIYVTDNNDYKLAIHGWKTITDINLENILYKFIPYGLKNILCTDISRDGTFLGPNIILYKNLKKKFPNIILQASGGINSLSDIYLLKKCNIDHVIIGRALLEKNFTFSEAQQCWQKE
ncbi:1-(5-phosphoribosyl)-5-[(5-phosphoribosylamino)methylideneamino] imidazole-4-carboxamide isomerase [Buchnera aphidicola]|uniref:1-(5-phosphoribosyl)-5-[(5-phosphoribosylamino)methylideneamino] imidazole-4-carboxamide isomerase n=1 Tax=Buchnera aphidicola (Cinara cf. splendens/pseudotsugae 3390) TaxID=2518980 RepID=A0A451CWC6_9GAMM|nr:1-(5-phosphoribosyl)-5-[(5-phosphoribosylamino)methylideneamino] imidazole-4-carboxamide isomerase [Buchnera aphidicola]VFP77645.1 1-(5-phosphoribosyl)-5-[(5-phosphoribosylamino)methylideneamino] imidazole-4-carboxamide isomerase [Buchnera aphidicola (Cinara cf. splendens/pseudotsugae 3390)]